MWNLRKLSLDLSRAVERRDLEAMCGAIHHRGPDDQGFYVKGPVGLGSARLAIIDVAGGNQPLHNEDTHDLVRLQRRDL